MQGSDEEEEKEEEKKESATHLIAGDISKIKELVKAPAYPPAVILPNTYSGPPRGAPNMFAKNPAHRVHQGK